MGDFLVVEGGGLFEHLSHLAIALARSKQAQRNRCGQRHGMKTVAETAALGDLQRGGQGRGLQPQRQQPLRHVHGLDHRNAAAQQEAERTVEARQLHQLDAPAEPSIALQGRTHPGARAWAGQHDG
ncbi:hypothetical protein D9M68_880350 [compost metagenome]